MPKKIQKILTEQNFWLIRGFKLEYIKAKCFNYQLIAKYKICIKKHKYNLCKVPKNYKRSIIYSKFVNMTYIYFIKKVVNV